MKRSSGFLAIFLAFVMVFADDGEGSSGDTRVPNPSYTLIDYYTGKTVSTTNSGAKAKVVIFGRVACPNTQSTMRSLSNSSYMADSGYEVMFIEEGTATDEAMAEFVDTYCSDYMTVCATSNDFGSQLMWNYMYSWQGSTSSVVYPVIFYIDENDNIRKMTTRAVSASSIISVLNSFDGSGGGEDTGIRTAVITANCGQSAGRAMLNEMNARRTGSNGTVPWCWNKDNTEKVEYSGLNELVYDYDLEKIATQRAAELAL